MPIASADASAIEPPPGASALGQEQRQNDKQAAPRVPQDRRGAWGIVTLGTWRNTRALGMVRDPGFDAMSWSELERFVADVEADQPLQRALKHCRSRKELILAGRRLGYRITRMDLERAWQEEQLEQAQRDQAAH